LVSIDIIKYTLSLQSQRKSEGPESLRKELEKLKVELEQKDNTIKDLQVESSKWKEKYTAVASKQRRLFKRKSKNNKVSVVLLFKVLSMLLVFYNC